MAKAQQLLNGYNLQGMIAVYHREVDNSMNYQSSSMPFYLEMHEVNIVDGKTVLGASSPLSSSNLQDLYKLLVKPTKTKPKREDVLVGSTENIIYCNLNPMHHVVVWRFKAEFRHMYFSQKKLNGKLWTPDLVFVATANKSLSVYAVDDKDNLYEAPFPNVYANADVCLGDCSLDGVRKATTFEELRWQWERIFFDSKFSEGVATEEQDLKLLQELIKTKAKFPVAKLRPQKKQLKNIQALLKTL